MTPPSQTDPDAERTARKELRVGFSTGTAAAAAAKAALGLLLEGRPPGAVLVDLPDGGRLNIAVHEVRQLSAGVAEAAVIKDGGDDPDVTHRAEVRARVAVLSGPGKGSEVILQGGSGVGRVTKPGLPVAVGQPAINPVPRRMIREALEEVWRSRGLDPADMRLEVEISVPRGELMAQRTMNPRLGIVGGISILGTHGLVKPFSHEGYTGAIESALSVAAAAGLRQVVLTTGGKSEKLARASNPELPEQAFIQIADFFAHALREAVKAGMENIGLVCFFGKAVKQAMGLAYTHAHQAPLDHERLAGWFSRAGAGPELVEQVRGANTARHVLEMLDQAGRLDLVRLVGERQLDSARGFAGPGTALWSRIMDFSGSLLYEGRREAGQ